ncbi:MAG: hypothetical protein GXO43_03895 [Crenarchaeota archaeon]|nr:hypothetical protein [Thermoproteota archaeon]
MEGDRNVLTVTTSMLGTDTLALKILAKTYPIMTSECPWAWAWSTTQSAPSGNIIVYECKTHPIFEASNTISTLFEWPTPTLGSTSAIFGDFTLSQEIIPWYHLLEISGSPLLVALTAVATAMQARQLLPLMIRYTVMGYTQLNYLTQADIKAIYNYNQYLASILHKSIITATQQVKNYYIIINTPEVIKSTGVAIIRTIPINPQIVYVGKSLGNIIYMTEVLQGYWKASMFVKQSWSFFDQIRKALEKASSELRAALTPIINFAQSPVSINPVVIKRIIQEATIEVVSSKPQLSHVAVEAGYRVIDLTSMLKAGSSYAKEFMKFMAIGPIIFASIAEYARATRVSDMERTLSQIVSNNIKTGIELSNLISTSVTTVDKLQKIIRNTLLLSSSISYSTGLIGLSSLITTKAIESACQDPTPTSLLRTFSSILHEYSNIGLSLALAMLKASEVIKGKSPITTYWIDYLSRILVYTGEGESLFSQVIGKLVPKDMQEWFMKIVSTTPYFSYLAKLIVAGVIAREAVTLLDQIASMITSVKDIVSNPKQTIFQMAWKLAKIGATVPGLETQTLLKAADKLRTIMFNMTKPIKTCPMIDTSIMKNDELWVLYKIYAKPPRSNRKL